MAGATAALLTGGAGALLAGCSSGDAGAEKRSSAARRLRESAGRNSVALLERYDATIAAHAALAQRLRPLRAEAARHAEAFGTGPAAPSASVSPSAAPAAPPVPGDERAALAALAEAERRTADSRTSALGSASPELARLLASVAAAGAAHAYLLTGGGS
ncbi:hypothetical protein AB0F13_11520 [Streptomyces sp. NPDC026206]|uniref:hypothetical protein n=1 Tax=Streptomyces sp. NPDC026206 TaxID=3157089 RepID=UPI0033D31A6D